MSDTRRMYAEANLAVHACSFPRLLAVIMEVSWAEGCHA